MKGGPSAKIYRGTARNLAFLAKRLAAGEIVAVPTETVYGLAGNALDVSACEAIFRAKGRPKNDPLIVHIANWAMLDTIAESNDAARTLARAFWPGPLTMVLPKRSTVPAIVSAGLPSVAVRMPRHPLFRKLIRLSGLPLAAPSANPFGYVSPTSAEHVFANLGKRISHILDGGSAHIGVESTIVDLRDPASPQLLRPGAITKAQLEAALRRRVLVPRTKVRANRAEVAPGRLARHYSPKTHAELHSRFSRAKVLASPVDEAWIFSQKPSNLRRRNVFWLDEQGSAATAARNLFAVLRRVDGAGFRRIHLERVKGSGLADAINDRLTRAASRG